MCVLSASLHLPDACLLAFPVNCSIFYQRLKQSLCNLDAAEALMPRCGSQKLRLKMPPSMQAACLLIGSRCYRAGGQQSMPLVTTNSTRFTRTTEWIRGQLKKGSKGSYAAGTCTRRRGQVSRHQSYLGSRPTSLPAEYLHPHTYAQLISSSPTLRGFAAAMARLLARVVVRALFFLQPDMITTSLNFRTGLGCWLMLAACPSLFEHLVLLAVWRFWPGADSIQQWEMLQELAGGAAVGEQGCPPVSCTWHLAQLGSPPLLSTAPSLAPVQAVPCWCELPRPSSCAVGCPTA